MENKKKSLIGRACRLFHENYSFVPALCFGALSVAVSINDPNTYGGIFYRQLVLGEKDPYYEVREIADIDKDGTTSVHEWAKVYEDLGVEFNPRNGRRLSYSELKKYIEIKKQTDSVR